MSIIFWLLFPHYSLLSLTVPLSPLALAPAGPAPSPPQTLHSNATLPAHPSLTRLLYKSKVSMTERPSMQQMAPLRSSRQRQRAVSHRLGQMAAAGPMVAAILSARNSRWQDISGIRDTDVTFMRSRERRNMTRQSACRIWTLSYPVSHFLPLPLKQLERLLSLSEPE